MAVASVPAGLDVLFDAKTEHTDVLAEILNFFFKPKDKHDTVANCYLGERGLKVSVVNASKTLLAHAWLRRELFFEYHLAPGGGLFGISLRTWMQCLQIFGLGVRGSSAEGPTRLQMQLESDGAPLVLLLQEGADALTDCSIRTLVPDPPLNFSFATEDVVVHLVVPSPVLHEALAELVTAGPSVTLEPVVGATPGLRLCAEGVLGFCEFFIPRGSMDSFDSLPGCQFTYQAKLLDSAIRAQSIAKSTLLRIKRDGVMSLQFLIERAGLELFVEYFVAPEEQVDDAPADVM